MFWKRHKKTPTKGDDVLLSHKQMKSLVLYYVVYFWMTNFVLVLMTILIYVSSLWIFLNCNSQNWVLTVDKTVLTQDCGFYILNKQWIVFLILLLFWLVNTNTGRQLQISELKCSLWEHADRSADSDNCSACHSVLLCFF